MKVLLVGPQGSGKSTQAKLLAKHFDIPTVETGEFFRGLSKNKTAIGKKVKELLDDIEEKIRLNLVGKRQKIIGFSVSEASANLFAIFLHKKNLIEPGFNINHSFFASQKRAENTFPHDFKNKKEIILDLVRIEELRNRLCYGREKEMNIVNSAIENLFLIKQVLDNEINKPDNRKNEK